MKDLKTKTYMQKGRTAEHTGRQEGERNMIQEERNYEINQEIFELRSKDMHP